MKKLFLLMLVSSAVLLACNNEADDSTEKADSANEAKADSANMLPVGTETASTLVDLADGGMAEVALGELASQKASHSRVKSFARMMVTDHTQANSELKSLASSKNVTLPDSASADKRSHLESLQKKSGRDFDRDYMGMMVDDHEKTINKLEKLTNDSDADVQAFANKALTKVRVHLDSARAIRDAVKQ